MVAAALPAVDEVTYHPHGAAAAIFGCRDKEVLIEGPAGTGKTYACLWKVHLCALKYPGMRAIILRKTLESLKSSALVTYVERVLGSGEYGVTPFGGSKLRPTAFRYPNGSEVVVGGMDKATKIMSAEYDLAYVNEATELAQSDWESITTRLRYGVMPYQQLLADCNPGPQHHWLNERADAGRATRFRSRHEENPALYDERRGEWTPMGLRYIETLENLSGVLYERLRLGHWVAAEGLVYPDWDRERIQTVDVADWRRLVGLDVGTNNPTAILDLAVAGTGRQHLVGMVYERGLSASQVVAATTALADAADAEAIVVDPSAAGYVRDLELLGYTVIKADNDRKRGVQLCTAALKSGLTVDPSCMPFVKEIEDYSYRDEGTSDDPVKVKDHALDSWRYVTVYVADPEPEVMFWA